MTEEIPTEKPEATVVGEARKPNRMKTGIGIGIGSAAVVAALLYANSSRKKKKPVPPVKPE